MTRTEIENLKIGNLLVDMKSLSKGVRNIIVINYIRQGYVHFDHIGTNGEISKGPSQENKNFLEEDYELYENVTCQFPDTDSYYVSIPGLIYNLKATTNTVKSRKIVDGLAYFDAWNPQGEINKRALKRLIKEALNTICESLNNKSNKG